MDKKRLKLLLTRLKVFDIPKLKLEQYSTPPEIASDVLWNAFMLGDIEGKVVLDAGCGTGILGIGVLLLGAKKVVFVDIDSDALNILKENIAIIESEGYEIGDYEIIEQDIAHLRLKDVDTVVQNPPFGTKQKHSDKAFLEASFRLEVPVYSLHKIVTKSFIEAISRDFKYSITHFWQYKYPLPKTQEFHTKRIQYLKVGCWRMVPEHKKGV